MSPEKEAKYKIYEKNQSVSLIEGIMNDQWETLASSVRIKTNQERKREE